MDMLKKLIGFMLLLTLAVCLGSCQLGQDQLKDVTVFYPVMECPLAAQPLEGKTLPEPEAKQAAAPGVYQPLNYDNMKGVWISYLEFGWALKGKSEAEFRANIQGMYDKVQGMGLNTVIVQVRSHGDAYYPSAYYPWSQFAAGSVGVDPGFDPLKIMIEEAHTRSLSVHGWINPYRLMRDEGMSLLSGDYLMKQWYQSPDYASYMAKVNDYWYLNPGNAEVQQLISNGVSELVTNYQLDGVQIDDYFYTASPETFGQDETQARQNTSATVQGIYNAVKQVNSSVLFGVSPAGNFTDVPRSDQTQYTDLMTWCTQEGYLDYVAPQIYWDFDDPVAPFSEVVSRWENLLKDQKCKLYIGLASYKFSGSESLSKQVAAVDACGVAKGYLHFRYDNLT